MTHKTLETSAIQIELSIDIQASVAATWHALCDQTNAWWPADFRMVSPNSVVSLEPRAGCFLMEICADAGSLLWYTVQLATPEASLVMAGHVSPPWGGPATSLVTLRLEAQGEGCRLHILDAQFGHLGPKTGENCEAGWQQIFGDGLRNHLEQADKH